jgi:hypothetical protein
MMLYVCWSVCCSVAGVLVLCCEIAVSKNTRTLLCSSVVHAVWLCCSVMPAWQVNASCR